MKPFELITTKEFRAPFHHFGIPRTTNYICSFGLGEARKQSGRHGVKVPRDVMFDFALLCSAPPNHGASTLAPSTETQITDLDYQPRHWRPSASFVSWWTINTVLQGPVLGGRC